MQIEEDCWLFQTSTGDADEALALAQGLVSAGLAACAQVQGPVRSIFRWQGAVQVDEEYLVQAKVSAAHYPSVEAYIRAHHSYELPECVAVRVAAGSTDFLAWWRANS